MQFISKLREILDNLGNRSVAGYTNLMVTAVIANVLLVVVAFCAVGDMSKIKTLTAELAKYHNAEKAEPLLIKHPQQYLIDANHSLPAILFTPRFKKWAASQNINEWQVIALQYYALNEASGILHQPIK